MAVTDNLTDGELTVLGLLADAPRHGYEPDRVIEQRGIRIWLRGVLVLLLLARPPHRSGLIELSSRDAGRCGRRNDSRQMATRCISQSADALEALTPGARHPA
jgi:hypothetical protein